MPSYADMDMPKRRAVGGRGTDQYNMGLRDPMVHEIKGQLAEERAITGRGTTAQEYRRLQNASHAHMRGGAMTGGEMMGMGVTGGRPQLAGGRMCNTKDDMTGGAPSVSGGMFTERQLKGLARAVGGGKPLGRTHAKMMRDIKGAGFFDDFQRGFMSVIRPVASIAKPLLSLAGPYGAAGAAGLSALGLGMGGMDSESEDEVDAVGGRRRKRASAGPNDARRARGAMVSRLMKERGMTLGEASKYIKQHGSA